MLKPLNKLNSINMIPAQNLSTINFEAKGQPLNLKYIVENRSYILPDRVLMEAQKILAKHKSSSLPSLLEIHRRVYAPLLKCNTLAQAKEFFKEFENVKEEIKFSKNNHYKKEFEERTAGDESFALKMLKEYWGNLKTIKEICESYGMKNRASLDWPLEQINFPKFHNKYKNLLLASDSEGTKVLAQRIYDYDNQTDSRRTKITKALQARWLANPEIRQAMSEFASNQAPGYRKMLDKLNAGKPLSDAEKRMNKGFFKRFWEEYASLKKT